MHQSALLGQGLLWRSLGRSLRANFIVCAARLCPAKNGGVSVQNKIFLGKIVRYIA